MRHDSKFTNVPELMQMYRQVADIQTQTMLKLPLPDAREMRYPSGWTV